MMVITHDLQVAERLCDSIGVMYAGQIIEQGTVEQIFHHPSHPYTKALLRSIPGKGMTPIPGTSPSLSENISGCKFHPRCKERLPGCHLHTPEVFDVINPTLITVTGTEAENASLALLSSISNVKPGKVRCFLYDSSGKAEEAIS
jgi:peptide/nickel transport system ATP-binding protein